MTIVFTVRGAFIRVISARPMSRSERGEYAKRATRKPLPVFASEREEREFWESHDTTPFADWGEARAALFPNLRPSTETISLRLPTALLSELKALANKCDVPYQSLLKVFLADRVAREAVRFEARPHKAVPPASRARRKPKSRRPSACGSRLTARAFAV